MKNCTKYEVRSIKKAAWHPALYLILSTLYLLLPSCGSDADDIQTPKPNAYFRIDLPDKNYTVFSDACPYEFEYPSNYSVVLPDSDANAELCWKNIVFPRFKAELHLTYKHLDGNLNKYLDESWNLATRHQGKASGMPETPIVRDSAKVYGLLFEIEGNAASSLQFFVTDSAQHFIRGALYFYARPNYDSLTPVINYIKKDVEKLITTLKWKKEQGQESKAKISH